MTAMRNRWREWIEQATATRSNAAERLDYLRTEIVAERISYGEIAELQDLARHIDPTDILLLQWAGVEEDQ